MNYRRQDSPQTLREGLDEYYRANPGFQFGDFLGMPRDVVQAHDVCHIVFGCGSTAADELVVETWTALGTYIPPRRYAQMLGDGLGGEIVRTFGPFRLVRRLVLTGPRVLKTAWAAMRMRKRWPHFGCEPYWDVSLAQLRSEFGIRVVCPEAGSAAGGPRFLDSSNRADPEMPYRANPQNSSSLPLRRDAAGAGSPVLQP